MPIENCPVDLFEIPGDEVQTESILYSLQIKDDYS